MEADTCKKELVIEIPVEVVRQKAETVAAQLARAARIPGFRPGHAPASLIRNRFRDDIKNEVVQALVPKAFEDAVKGQKLTVVGEPHFEDLKFEEDKPLTVKATFEVYPTFDLKEYKSLEVEEDTPSVSDADVDKALDKLRENAATYEAVEGRGAEDGDYLEVTYSGRDVNEPEKRPIESRDAMIHLGDERTVQGFSENLRGAKADEAREFAVAYPAEYSQKELAGKRYQYRVEVRSIKKRVLPPVDDELAKSVSDCSTLTELREKVRKDLEQARQRRAESDTKQKLVELLLEAHPFAVPESLVEAQLDRGLEDVAMQLVGQGIDPRATELDWRKIREDSRPEAEKRVRAGLILERIGEAEKVEVSDEEVDEMIREISEGRRETAASLKTRLTREGKLDRIRSSRRNQKTLDLIYRSAKITRKSG